MNEKRFSLLKVIHMVLMVVFGLMSLGSSIVLALAFTSGSVVPALQPLIVLYIGLNVVNILAYCCGIVYLWKDYGKNAAGFYKVFMLLTAVSTACGIAMVFLMFANQSLLSGIIDASPIIYALAITLRIVKIALLLALTFAKDLGKVKTWSIFCVLFVLDLGVTLLLMSPDTMAFSQIVSAVTRLVLDGTIGLAIYGKYADKAERMTK